MSTPSDPPPGACAVPVWDRFVRVFHWSLVACVGLNYLGLEGGEGPHRWVGYLASALVMARVVWGFVGTPHARFGGFAPTPARLRAEFRAWRGGEVPRHVGHTPLGALMMFALMGCVLALGLTGWLQGTDRFWGDERLQDLHELLGHVLIVGAGLHAAAALVMGRLEKAGLVRAMITGVKVFR